MVKWMHKYTFGYEDLIPSNKHALECEDAHPYPSVHTFAVPFLRLIIQHHAHSPF